MRALLAILCLWGACLAPAQDQGKKDAAKDPNAIEEEALRTALGEAGSSPLEMIRALEKHLARFPKSARRGEIERALAKSAVDARDNARILQYGEKYLVDDPSDLVILERVTRLLTSREDKESNERGLKYAVAFSQGFLELEKQPPENDRMSAQMRDELDRGQGRGFLFQAKAQGHLGNLDAAVMLAKRSFDVYPSSESAKEIATWLIKQNKNSDALVSLADAFAVPDQRVTDEERRKIREQMGDVYRKVHSDEKGMGDLILAAYDRAAKIGEQRKTRLRQVDPNADLTDPMDYTLTGVNGDKIDLKTLRGKVVVLDFWATWCGPCRMQYPIYEKVKKSFAAKGDVVFLGINTDQDRALVKPFLQQQQWNKAVYFEDGLSNLMRVSSIPATVIFNRRGEVATRMNGFVPERFEAMLIERIQEALSN